MEKDAGSTEWRSKGEENHPPSTLNRPLQGAIDPKVPREEKGWLFE